MLALLTAVVFRGRRWSSLLPLAQRIARSAGRRRLAALDVGRPHAAAASSCAPSRARCVIAGIALGLGLLVAIYSGRYLALDRRYETYYPLLLLLVAGLMGMVLAADLFNLYLFCELMSVAAYVLVAFRRHTDTAIEAGFKYLIMGSVGTIMMLMGISLIYRETGSLALPAVASTRPGVVGARRAGLPAGRAGDQERDRAPAHLAARRPRARAQQHQRHALGHRHPEHLLRLLKVSLGLGFPARALGTLLMVALAAEHDRGQRHGPGADAHQAAAGLFDHRPDGLCDVQQSASACATASPTPCRRVFSCCWPTRR